MSKERRERADDDSDWRPVIQPPASATVDMERKPLLYLPNGQALVRQIGYRTPKGSK